jgi:hypothetical protein
MNKTMFGELIDSTTLSLSVDGVFGRKIDQHRTL